ncbi:MAG: hypothetical protein QW743_00855 [Candidatus Methanomethylicia archaeon]
MENAELERFIIETIGSTGRVTKQYYEHEIEVLDPINFPWYRIIEILTSLDYELSIIRRNDVIVVRFITKPKY